MLAARSSGGGLNGGGHTPHHVISMNSSKVHHGISQESKGASPSKKQEAPPRKKAALLREMEAVWCLRMFGVSKEETVAHKTGMMYRSVSVCLCHKVHLFVLQQQQCPWWSIW